MLILLPPSESKRSASRGAPLQWDRLSWPELTATRRLVAGELARVSAAPDATDRLGLPPGLADQVRRNCRLESAPAMATSRLYDGVLYNAADLSSLHPAAKRRASRWLVVSSALFGALRLNDRVPAYRLSMSTAVPGLAPLARLWRPVLNDVMPRAAGASLVVDCRSGSYAATWTPRGDVAQRWVRVRVPGATHGAKHTRGLLTRAICQDGIDARTPQALAEALTERFEVSLEPPERDGSGWTLDVLAPGASTGEPVR